MYDGLPVRRTGARIRPNVDGRSGQSIHQGFLPAVVTTASPWDAPAGQGDLPNLRRVAGDQLAQRTDRVLPRDIHEESARQELYRVRLDDGQRPHQRFLRDLGADPVSDSSGSS